MSNICLGAFENKERLGYWNVWRYDTPSTRCVLFQIKATDAEDAKAKALKAINGEVVN
jgi:hypothetical protein